MTDLKIANKNIMQDIKKIASDLGLDESLYETYGKYKAKLSLDILKFPNKESNLILVTSINPTPAGEGKSTTSIGLADALNKLNKKTLVALREPSVGPVFGLKGGATGGGFSQVVPMEDINLHFTGDIHAITSANNLISAILDNHIYQGNELNINIDTICFNRVLDSNDRTLRNITIGQGKKVDGVQRQDHFSITASSEIMAILCLASDFEDLKRRIANIIVAFSQDNKMITVKDLGCTGAVCLLLKDAIKPNLVQTLEKTPALIHGGPFANIAHGCSSIVATNMALKLANYVVTEAGFGADLGAEKFFNIKCRTSNLKPKCAVIVVTIKALKMHGGLSLDEVTKKNLDALIKGIENLEVHINNIKKFNVDYIIAVNKFNTDTDCEINLLLDFAKENGHPISLNESWSKGSEGSLDLAKKVLEIIDKNNSSLKYLYETNLSIEEKIKTIAMNIYNAKEVNFDIKALEVLKEIKKNNLENLLVCMAKTQYSFSDNPLNLGKILDHTITIKDIKISNGAGFVVCLAGNILTMPGLPKKPAALDMDIFDGIIKGLF